MPSMYEPRAKVKARFESRKACPGRAAVEQGVRDRCNVGDVDLPGDHQPSGPGRPRDHQVVVRINYPPFLLARPLDGFTYLGDPDSRVSMHPDRPLWSGIGVRQGGAPGSMPPRSSLARFLLNSRLQGPPTHIETIQLKREPRNSYALLLRQSKIPSRKRTP